MSLSVRVEFNNIFNRTYLNNPVAQARNAAGETTGGFGFINRAVSSTQFGQPRNGTFVVRLLF
jgi:hypothetical protein